MNYKASIQSEPMNASSVIAQNDQVIRNYVAPKSRMLKQLHPALSQAAQLMDSSDYDVVKGFIDGVETITSTQGVKGALSEIESRHAKSQTGNIMGRVEVNNKSIIIEPREPESNKSSVEQHEQHTKEQLGKNSEGTFKRN